MNRDTMASDSMMSARSEPEVVDVARPVVDAAAHGASLVVGVLVAVLVGQPVGWIAFLLPLGPLVVIGVASLSGRAPRASRSLMAFTLMSVVVIGGGWALTFAGELWGPLSLLYPLGVLAFIAGLVNWLMIVLSRVWRAVRRWPFDYPWIPRPLALLVGLPGDWEE